MFSKDEPKNQPGTSHLVVLDGDNAPKSQTWLQTDRHQVNAPTAIDEVLTALTWVSLSALTVHLIRLLTPLALPVALFITALLGCFGIYSLITETPKTFYSYLVLFFLALILVTL